TWSGAAASSPCCANRGWRPERPPAKPRAKTRLSGRTAMTPPQANEQFRMSETEFEALLARAAERGARRALADVGLEGKEAALDVRDLRSLIECIRFVRRTVVQTAVRLITTGILLALLAGIAIKLKLFGNGP